MVMPDTAAAGAGSNRADASANVSIPHGIQLWTLGIAMGVLLGVVDSSQSVYLGKEIGVHLPWPRVVASNVIYWAVLAALVPAVFWLARRVRLDGPWRLVPAAVHVVAGVAFGVVHVVIWVVLTGLLPGFGDHRARFLATIRDYA